MFWGEVIIGGHRLADWVVVIEPFMNRDGVEIPLLEVVKHTKLSYLEEVGLRGVIHTRGNLSKQVESLVNTAWCEIVIGCLGFSVAD
jgi:hypothetical protein